LWFSGLRYQIVAQSIALEEHSVCICEDGSSTFLQDIGTYLLDYNIEVNFFNLPNLSGRTRPWDSLSV
jgi:hypothetical protein